MTLKMVSNVNVKLVILVKNVNFMMTSVHQLHVKMVQVVTLELVMLQSVHVLLDGLATIVKLEVRVANQLHTNKKLQFHKFAKMVAGVLIKEPHTDATAKMNLMDHIVKLNAIHVLMSRAKIEARALSSTVMLCVIVSHHGQDPVARFQNLFAKKNQMHVTTLAFVLTYHMIPNTATSVVVLLVHMAVGANEIQTIVRTNYLMEIIAMAMVNVMMESDVKI